MQKKSMTKSSLRIMAPNRKETSSAKKGSDHLKKEEVLEAILLADTFTEKFRPISFEAPNALMPLVNIPLIDYTLELLIASGVERIFVFCSAHANIVDTYLKNSKWFHLKAISIQTILLQSCMCLGDALREVDALGLVRNDFILVSGGVVSNMNLAKVVEQHRQRRKLDKNYMMTMVFNQLSSSHRTRPWDHEMAVVVDAKTQQILHYPSIHETKAIAIEPELFEQHPHFHIHTNWMDCHIDICAPEVLEHFTDSFDYQSREEFY